MTDKLEKKRENELKVVGLIIDLYCHHHHKTKKERCENCEQLYQYAKKRIELCPFMETKTFCSNCKVHCYQKEYRSEIRKVMRYSGPRMLMYHPVLAIKHMILSIKEKRKNEN